MASYPPLLLIFALFTLNPVTISVYPHFSLPPATFRITVLVPRDATNRRICWKVDGPELRSSCLDLAGTDARKAWQVFWDLRTPGEYEAVATLTRMVEGREKVFTDRQPFRVLGMEP